MMPLSESTLEEAVHVMTRRGIDCFAVTAPHRTRDYNPSQNAGL
jgi:hypothetical protein